MGLLERLGRLAEKLYENKVKTAVLSGLAVGAFCAYSQIPQIGKIQREYKPIDIAVKAIAEPEKKGLKPFELTQYHLAYRFAFNFAVSAALTYFVLNSLGKQGGVKRIFKGFKRELTPKQNTAERKKLLEEMCGGGEKPHVELYAADRVVKEDADFALAAEHYRRAMIATVRELYRSSKGNAEHNKGSLMRYVGSLFNPPLREEDNVYMCAHLHFVSELEGKDLDALMHQSTIHFTPITRHRAKKLFEMTRQGNTDLRNIYSDITALAYEYHALAALENGCPGSAEANLEYMCECIPGTVPRAIYGSFLDAMAPIDDECREKAERHWSRLIEEIVNDSSFSERFARIPGSRNEVLEFRDSPTTSSLLIIKRSKKAEDIEHEFRVSQFLFDMLGIKGIVPEPITLRQVGEYTYFIQKRLAGRTVQEVLLAEKEFDETRLQTFLDVLMHYQSTIQKQKGAAKRYGVDIPSTDYRTEFGQKFVERLKGSNPEHDTSRLCERAGKVFEVLQSHKQGFCHGDLHARNCIVYGNRRAYLIDHEKASFGARILDWANFVLHTKVELGIDVSDRIDDGYDFFRKRGESEEGYLAAYHSAAVFKASHLAGTVIKGWSSSGLDAGSAERKIRIYVSEAQKAAMTLSWILPLNARQAMQELAEEYSTILRLQSPLHW